MGLSTWKCAICQSRGAASERASDTGLFTCENNNRANQIVDTSFFTGGKNRTTNQLASLVQRDYLHLDAFWRVNLGTYLIIFVIFITDLPDSVLIL